MKRLLTPRDLADAIGVSEASLSGWAAEGTLAVGRTKGGHRRIPITEAVRFIRASGATIVDPEALGLSEMPVGDGRFGENELYGLLYEGMGKEARGLLLRRYLGGESLAALADGPIRGAMGRLGELWKHDARGVFIEHRATDCCIQAVTMLRALVEAPDDGPIALGGAPSGDPYLLPSMLAAAVLAAEGMRAVNLGPETPIASIRFAVAAHRPALVWLSFSTRIDADVAAEVRELARSLRDDGSRLVIGGRHADAVAEATALPMVATMTELATFAGVRPE